MWNFITPLLYLILFVTMPYHQEIDSLLMVIHNAQAQEKVDLLNDLSHLYSNESPDKGVISGMEALRLSEQLGYKKGIAYSFHSIAENQFSLGEFEKSVEYQLQALDIFKSIDEKSGMVLSLNSLGLCFREMGDIEKSLSYHNQALELSELTGDFEGKVKALVSIGICNFAANAIDQTLKYFNQALEISLELGNDKLTSTVYNNMGICYATMEDYDRALDIFLRSLQLNTKSGNKSASAAILNNIARLYIYMAKYADALDAINQSFELNQNLRAKAQLVNNYFIYYEYYQVKEDYQKALDYYIQYSRLKDEIIKERSQERVANLQILNELENKERDLEILNKNYEITKNRKKLYIVLFITSLIILLLGVFLLVMRNRAIQHSLKLLETEKLLASIKLKNQQMDYEKLELLKDSQQRDFEETLAAKNRNLASLTMQMVHKNEILTVLKKQIETLTYSAENKTTVDEVCKLIDQSINLNEDWENFTMHFDNVHPKFFERLMKEFPSLTQRELKQCAYIRINISIKEIAQLLNITPKAVEKARSRIKAKLLLDKDDDLTNFLLTY